MPRHGGTSGGPKRMRETFRGEHIGQAFADTHIYPALSYTVVSRATADRTHDVDLLSADGTPFQAEEKFMRTHHGKILVEVVQDIESGDRGWYYDVTATRLNLFYCTTDWAPHTLVECYWPGLRRWLETDHWYGANWSMSSNGYGHTIYATWDTKQVPGKLWRIGWASP